MENISDYLIKNPKQILTHLKMVSKKKCLISASFGKQHTFLTAILKIDAKKQIIVIDCGPKEYLNNVLLNSEAVHCEAKFNGIQVIFEGRDIKKADKSFHTALSIKIPNQLYWVQRRLSYRVRSPLSKNSYCSITFESTKHEDLQNLNFIIFDLSASGFSIISDNLAQSNKIPLGVIFKDCKFVLNGTDTFCISFLARNKQAVNPSHPSRSQRIGCEFLNITPKEETAFLKYMQEIERELINNFD